MRTRDLVIQKTKEARNELEGYIYDMRSQVSDRGQLVPFVTAEAANKFVELAGTFESWLYGDEGQEAKLADYASRLDQLTAIGQPAQHRFRMHDELSFAEKHFAGKVDALRQQLNAKRGKEAHITDDDIQGGLNKCNETHECGSQSFAQYHAAPRYLDANVTPAQLDAKIKELETAVKAVVNKKPPPPPKPAAAEAPKADAAPKDDAAHPPPPPAAEPKGPDAPVDLD